MKILSVILVACVLFLSAFGGSNQPVQQKLKDCCKKMAHTACAKPIKKAKDTEGCSRAGCGMMFSCSICGFVIKQPLALTTLHAHPVQKPVARYMAQIPNGYIPNNWKPPQTC